ncbi:phosphatidic acid phosphatase [Candidatus Marinamargulisbacteria bacterium SCGC AG-414-C22]|nr:phosphatidic acid phosphatase [Candidatus Marinamargulisbacteria bacterium SCGC AG-414-C22]
MCIRYVVVFFSVFFLFSCTVNDDYKIKLQNADIYHKSVQNLTDVIVHDIFSPPVASRVYVYPNIAAYEIIRQHHVDQYKSLVGQLNGLGPIPQNDDSFVDYHLASLHAFIVVSKELIFSESFIIEYQKNLYKQLKSFGIPRRVFKRSLKYGDIVANHILAWAKKDNYHQTRTYPKYTIQEGFDKWKPTPPDYMDGIEPSWDKIRPLVLHRADQFSPKPPLPLSLDKQSPFYQQLLAVYHAGLKLTKEQTAIASFWDCNPYVSHHRGHAMFATKKITPGGHWIGIVKIASKQAESSYLETVAAYSKVSIVLFDAFISCWQEKWRSLVVRPETLINDYIDENWLPALQTPPFPEYTSGHSVISKAAAVVLTDIYGDSFEFLDTTELLYGLPARQFSSFHDAADEAAISRFYGGIHYMMAITAGVEQGERVGNFVVKNVLIK